MKIRRGDWVRLKNNCDMHPSKPNVYLSRKGEDPPREFIGIYLSKGHVDWMSRELPEEELTHWNPECLELLQRGPEVRQ